MGIKSGLNADTPKRIFVDAGAVYLNYGLPSERLLGATRGGNEFNLNREIRDIEVDGVRGSVKGLRRRTVCRPQITCNLIELSLDNLLKAIAGANSAETKATAVVDAEYLGVGSEAIDEFTVAHYPVVAKSEKVYIDGVLKERGTKSESLFVGNNATNNKDFTTDIGDWDALTGGTLTSETGGQAGNGGKYVVGASPSVNLLKLDDALGTVLTNLEVGKKYRITIYAKKGTDWDGGKVTIKCDGQSKELPDLTTEFVMTVFDFTATGTDSTITIDCASAPTQNDELWIDTLGFVQFSGDYTIVNSTGVITFNLEDVPTAPNATAEMLTVSYTYETGDPATHDTITGGDIGDEDYIENVALVGTISGKGDDVICMVKNALADTGFSLSTAPRDEAVPVIVFTGHYNPADPDTEPWDIRYPRA